MVTSIGYPLVTVGYSIGYRRWLHHAFQIALQAIPKNQSGSFAWVQKHPRACALPGAIQQFALQLKFSEDLMTNSPNKIIPNSFQTPNFFVDECMPYSPATRSCAWFSWHVKHSDGRSAAVRISKSQIIQATGLNAETIDSCMEALVKSSIVLRVQKTSPQ